MGFPVIIIGGIYTGLFSPTEAAAASVLYALIFATSINTTEVTIPDDKAILGISLILMDLKIITSSRHGFLLGNFFSQNTSNDQCFCTRN